MMSDPADGRSPPRGRPPEPKQKSRPADADGLRLVAFDDEDLAVLSVHLQDAIVRVADMAYLPHEGRFALVAMRFDWANAGQGRPQRRLAGLHFERVRRAALHGFDLHKGNRVLNLLSIVFLPAAEAPEGQVLLTFSGGAAVRLDVECLEGQMRDVGPRWRARHRPDHPDPQPPGARRTGG